ncbi:tryptophan synthase subunit alpha [candidate division WOR-3 bacterium]|nr:tryptophan synthase subunit alpha [candidate division WOR-3 bacterium]
MRTADLIGQAFKHAAARNEAALVTYCTAGFPDLARSMEIVRSCATHGADIVEIGVPFSDPVADGPSIQYSSHKALEKGVTLQMILSAVQDLDTNVPVVLMSYLNPIISYGWNRFLDRAKRSHVAGIIIPDLPVEEAAARANDARAKELDLVLLAAPTSTPERLQRIVDTTHGFIYCISTIGTTGIRMSLDSNVRAFLERVRAITDKPRAVGFGISKPAHIRALRDCADGVVVGSRIIKAIRNEEDIPELIHSMKETTRR